ncbi:high mobility group B protein 13 [Momordica charantia]|uniref:High mobility group B protein 13 n=1 Tax=Momordica charantia TaxID=3673 RepID=A0A6J1C6T7_MOMCH|nr:high mobility group B protein 13 [Momordica charantia]
MADSATAEIPINGEPAGRTKKPRNSRKALKDKNSSPEEPQSQSMVTKVTQSSVEESLSQNLSSPKKSKSKAAPKKQQAKPSFDKELQEMQDMLQQLRLDKEKTEELLKAKDEILKQKDEELKTRDKEQEKLHIELKKLQKLKEFKPTMNFPMVQIYKDKEQEKKEKKKCPEKKRPSPPYILWCKDQWNEIKKENPEAEFKEISNILGAKWKTITADEKKPYEGRYQAEKEAFLQITSKEKRESEAMKLLEEEQKQKTAMELLEQYLQFKGEAEKENKKKKEKDPLKPKQPMSAFFLFSNERRATLLAENKNILEVAKLAGEEWKNMTEEQRVPYEEMAKKNRDKYTQEMEIYKQKKEEEAAILKKEEEEQMKLQKHEALMLLKKKEKNETIIKKTKEERQKKKKEGKKNVDPNKPKKPASSYILFSKEARKTVMEERPGVNNSTVNALISVKWKELSEGERKIWNDRAAEAMEGYKKEVEEYNKTVAEMKNAADADEKKA